MVRVRLMTSLCLTVCLLAGCRVNANRPAYSEGYGVKPTIVMSATYKTETQTVEYSARRSGANVPDAEPTEFYGDGTALLAGWTAGFYSLDRPGVDSQPVMSVSMEYRSVSPAIVETVQLRAVTASAVPDSIRLADGFVIGWAGEPLAKGESLAILIRQANGDDWGYGDHVLKKLDGNYLVVAPDVTPNIGGVALLPGAYDVAIERSAATSRTESGFLVVSRAAYVSSWTAVTVAP